MQLIRDKTKYINKQKQSKEKIQYIRDNGNHKKKVDRVD